MRLYSQMVAERNRPVTVIFNRLPSYGACFELQVDYMRSVCYPPVRPKVKKPVNKLVSKMFTTIADGQGPRRRAYLEIIKKVG